VWLYPQTHRRIIPPHRLTDTSKQVCHDAAGLLPGFYEGFGVSIYSGLGMYAGIVDDGGVLAKKQNGQVSVFRESANATVLAASSLIRSGVS